MHLNGSVGQERVCYIVYARGRERGVATWELGGDKWNLFTCHDNLDYLKDILSCPFTPEFKPKEGVGKALFKKIISAYPQGFWPNEKELAV